MNKKAFRCKNCSHLEPAEHAGESPVPHACSVCGAGVTFSPQGVKIFQPENWEVLAELSQKKLKEIGLDPKHVAKHTSTKDMPEPGKNIEVTAKESLKSKDKA